MAQSSLASSRVATSAPGPLSAAPTLSVRPKCPITIRGGFSPIDGMVFVGQSLPKGRLLMGNIFNVEEMQNSDAKVIITAKILRSTSLNDVPYSIHFEVDSATRDVIASHCSCVSGGTGKCKHGAALFQYINEERTVGKTDDTQQWTTPSKKLQARFPKGQTVQQIYGRGGGTTTSFYVQQSQQDEGRYLPNLN
jgi:hypothetical protein